MKLHGKLRHSICTMRSMLLLICRCCPNSFIYSMYYKWCWYNRMDCAKAAEKNSKLLSYVFCFCSLNISVLEICWMEERRTCAEHLHRGDFIRETNATHNDSKCSIEYTCLSVQTNGRMKSFSMFGKYSLIHFMYFTSFALVQSNTNDE